MIVQADDRIRAPQSDPAREAFGKRPPGIKRKVRFRVFKRDNFRCVYCGTNLLRSLEVLLTATVDHLKPRSDGGESDIDNLVTACRTCNSLKAGTACRTLLAGFFVRRLRVS